MPDAQQGDRALEIRVDPSQEDIIVIIPGVDGDEDSVLSMDEASAEAMAEGLQEALKIMAEYRSLPGAGGIR